MRPFGRNQEETLMKRLEREAKAKRHLTEEDTEYIVFMANEYVSEYEFPEDRIEWVVRHTKGGERLNTIIVEFISELYYDETTIGFKDIKRFIDDSYMLKRRPDGSFVKMSMTSYAKDNLSQVSTTEGDLVWDVLMDVYTNAESEDTVPVDDIEEPDIRECRDVTSDWYKGGV